MTEDDHGSAREGQHGLTPGVAAPRRGPVIRTSDFVTPAKKPAPEPAKPGPADTLTPQQRFAQEWLRRERQDRDTAKPAPPTPTVPVRSAPEPATLERRVARRQESLEDVSERLARLAPASQATAPSNPPKRADEPGLRTLSAHRREEAALSSPVDQPTEPMSGAPFLDAAMVLQASWTHRKMVLVLVLGMAVLGGLAFPFLPRKYTASTTLYFDPQQVTLGDGAQAPPVSQEAVMALIDSQSQILVSRRVLSRVAADLKLEGDREFGGAPGATSAKLAAAVAVEREANTYVVNLAVKSKDPEKSAAIANGIVTAFTMEQETVANGAYDKANTTLGSRLEQLADDLRTAETAAADFKARNNIDGAVATDPASGKRTGGLETLLLTAQSRTIAAKARYDAIAKFKVADLASGTTPADGTSTAIAQLQQQYATASSTVSSLETKLGARHPQLVAARATLSGVSDQIRQEVTRLITSAEAEYERAQKEENAVAKELTVQKALDNNLSGKLIEFRELQRKADAARDIYQTVLKRTRQSGEEQRLLQSNVRVISPAEAPLQADGPGRSVLLLGCVFGGLVVGLMLGVFYAVLRLLLARNRQGGENPWADRI